jgi:CRISP-associated protein Cas1
VARVNLQALPRFSDGWTFLYVERVRIDRKDSAIVIHDERGSVSVPAAALAALLAGPGTTLTHAAIVCLAGHGCSVVWTGEGGSKLYASGAARDRSAANLAVQARAWADEAEHYVVVQRMYRLRFAEELDPHLTLEQVRGKEGVRVRQAYAEWSRRTGIPWIGRAYTRSDWQGADPVNQALSMANAYLYATVHAGVLTGGFSPSLGFVHTGKHLSFVYDIADLYKVEICVPTAFLAVKSGGSEALGPRVRRLCRDAFLRAGILRRVIPDIQRCLGQKPEPSSVLVHGADDDGVVGLWDPGGLLAGGHNHAPPEEQQH